MTISIALLGFGAVGKEVYKQLQEVSGFMDEFRIHVIQVPDLSNYSVAKDDNWYNWLGDESFGTAKQVTIGDDTEWLIDSDGHDTVVDCTSYNEASKQLVFDLLAKGHWLITCSKELVSNHWRELVEIAKKSNGSISFNAIPASAEPTEYDGINLTQDNFADYSDGPLYIYRNAGPEETAAVIVKDLIRAIHDRKEQKARWESMSLDEQQAQIARDLQNDSEKNS